MQNSWKLSCLASLMGVCLMFSGCEKNKPAEEQKPAEPVTLRIANVLDDVAFSDAHLKGDDKRGVVSIQLPFMKVEESVKAWEKNVPVVVYCSNYQCTASDDVAHQLKKLGFADVMVYKGGMAEWFQLSKTSPEYQVEGPAQLSYLQIKVDKPTGLVEKDAEGVRIIDAQELLRLIKEAKMLQ